MLVLVRNSRVEQELSHKTKPCYFGPMVVIRRMLRGSYVLSELDGSLSALHFAAFRVIPYFARSRITIPITRLLDISEDELQKMTTDDPADDSDEALSDSDV